MKKIEFKFGAVLTIILLLFITFAFSVEKKNAPNNLSSRVKITFKNQVGKSAIVLRDSVYINPFGEQFSITKLRYYITNVALASTQNTFGEKDSYHLVDESKPESESLTFSLPAGNYTSLEFLIGVDSLHNVSGAQTGDLDPTKDMFWTWNSGYVMAKMEGNSPASRQVNNKYEFHIGGYSSPFNVVKTVKLDLDKSSMINFKPGETVEIIIVADINTWFHGSSDIKIAEHPVITTPGKIALAMSDNYSNMFRIERISE